MSGKILARAAIILLALTMSACGGDENSSALAGPSNSGGTGGETGGGSTPGETADVGTIELLANPVQIDTSPSSESAITARVKDSNGVLLSDVEVGFSASNGGTLEVSQSLTDASGIASAVLTTDGDARNRTVTVTATSGTVSDTIDVEISGTSISIAGATSIAQGASTSLRVSLEDADGNGIPNQTISLSTTLGTLSASTLTSSGDGIVDVQLSSGSSGGTATITASAYSGASSISATKEVVIASDSFSFTSPDPATEVDLNTTQEIVVEWLVNGAPIADGTEIQFTSTRGTLTPADGSVTTSGGQASIDIISTNAGNATVTASAPSSSSGLSADLIFEFVATTPDQIILQANKTQLNLNETTELVAVVRDANNNLVKNQDVVFSIIEDGSGGSLSTSRDVTDSQGRASTVYRAGANSSSRDGVEIEATVAGSITDRLTMTVARQALRLAIGTGNQIEEPDDVRYVKNYVAFVSDANGAPVENANVELSVLPTEYRKGSYVDVAGDWALSPGSPIECPAEDTNQNGELDAGEDANGSGKLEPTNVAVTSSSSVTSGADGSAGFSLQYPQEVCNWVSVRLTATVNVGGSESIETSEFYLPCLASDLNNTDVSPPGGTEGFYGSEQNCANLD